MSSRWDKAAIAFFCIFVNDSSLSVTDSVTPDTHSIWCRTFSVRGRVGIMSWGAEPEPPSKRKLQKPAPPTSHAADEIESIESIESMGTDQMPDIRDRIVDVEEQGGRGRRRR